MAPFLSEVPPEVQFLVGAFLPVVSAVRVAVPEAAVQTVEDRSVVFVRTDTGFATRPVTLGARDQGFVEVSDGLEAGVELAAAGSFTLKSELGKASADHAH